MRPLLETDADRTAEVAIIKEVLACWKLDDYRKQSLALGVDFALLKNPGFGFGRPKVAMFADMDVHPFTVTYAEVKKRNLKFGYGDGYYLAVQKVRSAWMLNKVVGVKTRLVIRFDDGIIRWCPINIYNDRVIWAGRTDRGWREDREPHVVFDWVVFEELLTGEEILP